MVYATAGSDEKRDYLRLTGVEHIFDSRDLSFADAVMAASGGEGVDVVLNSLAGAALKRSLEVLKPFGRFLELGKRDFYENSRIGLRALRQNIAYHGIDADQMQRRQPELARRMFDQTLALFRDGALTPLPHVVHDASRIADAFRLMQQSRHIGKLVVAFDAALGLRAAPRECLGLALKPEATYLVTGGLGGFGLATARWLARKGAHHLALVGRSGAASEEAKSALAAFADQGVAVRVIAADVARAADMQAIFDEIDATMPPLAGLVHAAMVLDDVLIANMARAQLASVLAPKVAGAWNLHQATRRRKLDFFVLYSSATTLLGNPGQANYVAANLFLESLARHRRAEGLPALAIAWGAIADAGYLARNVDVRRLLKARIGGAELSAERALDMLERALLDGRDVVAALDLDWRTIRRALAVAGKPKFALIEAEAGEESGDHLGAGDVRALIAAKTPDEIRAFVADVVRRQVAQILRADAERLDSRQPIVELGLDSLMAVELILSIEQQLAVKLPAMAINEGASINALAERIAATLLGERAAEPAENDTRATIDSLALRHIGRLDDATLDAATREMANSTDAPPSQRAARS